MKSKSEKIGDTEVFKLTIEQLQASVFITNTKGQIVYVNPFFVEKSGYSVDEAIGENPSLISSGEHTQAFYNQLWETISSGKTWHGEILNKKKNGETYWCEVTISNLKNDAGEVTHYVAIEHDISEQKKALYTSARRENLLNDIQFLSDTGGWHYDVKRGEMYWTDELYKIHGIKKGTEQDLITKSLSCYHPDDRVKVSRAFRQLLADGTPYDLTMRITDQKGNQKWIRTTTRAVHDEDGNVHRVYGSVMDITNDVATKESLYSSYRERGVLLSEIHHRVKNNLAMISGLLQLQVMGMTDKGKRSVLNKSIYRINAISLIHELLYRSDDFSEISLARSIKVQAEEMHRIYDTSTKINFDFDLDDVSVSINQAQPVGLLIHEILSNSFSYAFKGRKEGNILIRLRTDGDEIRLFVSDDGSGTERSKLDKAESLGALLIENLILQLDADCMLHTDNGVSYAISFKKESKPQIAKEPPEIKDSVMEWPNQQTG